MRGFLRVAARGGFAPPRLSCRCLCPLSRTKSRGGEMEGELARSRARLPSLLLALLGLGPGECTGGRHRALAPRGASWRGGWRQRGLRAGVPTPSRHLPAPLRVARSPPRRCPAAPPQSPGAFRNARLRAPALTRGFITKRRASGCGPPPPRLHRSPVRVPSPQRWLLPGAAAAPRSPLNPVLDPAAKRLLT